MADAVSAVAGLVATIATIQSAYFALRSRPRDIDELLIESLALKEILLTISEVITHNNTREFDMSVALFTQVRSCQATLMTIQKEADHLIASKSNQRPYISLFLRRALRADRIKLLKQDLDRHKSTFAVLLSGMSMISSRATVENVANLQRQIAQLQSLGSEQLAAYEESVKRADAQRLRFEILDWLSSYDYQAAHIRNISDKADKTGTWFVYEQAYKMWKQGEGHGILIITGVAGSGKTILCTTVVEDLLQQKDCQLAYFYVNIAEKLSSAKILGTLLRQLLEETPVIPAVLRLAFQSNRSVPPDFEQLQSALHEIASTSSGVYIVIDGLDKLTESVVADLQMVLTPSALFHSRCIIFSRQSPQLHRFKKDQYWREFFIDNSQHESDIRELVKSRLDKDPQLLKRPELLQEVRQMIVTRASGNFLWTKLVLEQVKVQRTARDIRKVILEVPPGLASLYEVLWRQMNEASRTAMFLVALSNQMLTTTQLEVLVNRIAKENLNEEMWTFEENGLISVNASHRVSFIHATVRDWLKPNETLTETSFRVFTSALRTVISDLFSSRSEFAHVNESTKVREVGFYQEETTEHFDDTSSVISNSSSIFSSDTTISSQSSISSALSGLESVVHQFSRFFIEQQAAKSAILACLERKGKDGFEKIFSNALVDYSKDLRLAAINVSHDIAASFVARKAKQISGEVVLMSGYLDATEIIRHQVSTEQRHNQMTVLDQYLGQKKLQDVTGIPHDRIEETHSGTQRSEEDLQGPLLEDRSSTDFPVDSGDVQEHSQIQDPDQVYLNLETIKTWLSQGAAFTKFLKRLSEDSDGFAILPPLPPTSQMPDRAPNWLKSPRRKLFRFVLNLIPGGEPPLTTGMKRVRWVCFCGRHCYDDFYEIEPGAIASIQRALDSVYPREIEPMPLLRSLGVYPGAFQASYLQSLTVLSASVPILYFVWANLSSTTVPHSTHPRFGMVSVRAQSLRIMTNLLRGGAFAMLVTIGLLSVSIVALFFVLLNLVTQDSTQGKLERAITSGSPSRLSSTNFATSKYRSPNASAGSAADSPDTGGDDPQIESSRRGGLRLAARGDFPGGQDNSGSRERTWEDDGDPAQLSDSSGSSDSSGPQEPSRARQVRRLGFETLRNQYWIFAIFPDAAGDDIYVHLNASQRKSDFALFSGFREKYHLVSNAWNRFFQLRQVSSIRYVKFTVYDERRGDVQLKDVWPPKHDPRIWWYDPYPAHPNVPLVSTKTLMSMWRDPHHSDRTAYNEFWSNATGTLKLIEWLRSFPHLILQMFRNWVTRIGNLDNLDDDGLDLSFVIDDDNFPDSIHRRDMEQPTHQTRNKMIFNRTPKKAGDKIRINWRENTHPEAWGLVFEESFQMHRLLFFIDLLYAVASLALLSWLLRKYGIVYPSELSTVLAILGWFSTFFGLTMTVWFKWGEARPK